MRRADWEVRLSALILERAHTPFAYGIHDCSLWAADCILAMTGADPAAEFRGYRTALGARRAIRRVTRGSTVEDAAAYCAQKHGWPEVPKLHAQRGDLVLCEDMLGIVHLNGREISAPGDNGLLRLPLLATKRAWRV